MDCPYCGKEMAVGFIKTHGEVLVWTPENERNPLTRWSISPSGIQLGDYSFFRGGKVSAYHCHECRKTIIEE